MPNSYFIESADFDRLQTHLPQLIELLLDSVNGGATVGFLPPIGAERARDYWLTVADGVANQRRLLLVALDAGGVLGSVQLDLAQMPNSLHRAEIMKLLVHSSQRGKGIGSALMRAIEREAAARGRTLLILDTRRGDNGERLYGALGYRKAGVIPGYARSADGTLHDTVIFYRHL